MYDEELTISQIQDVVERLDALFANGMEDCKLVTPSGKERIVTKETWPDYRSGLLKLDAWRKLH